MLTQGRGFGSKVTLQFGTMRWAHVWKTRSSSTCPSRPHRPVPYDFILPHGRRLERISCSPPISMAHHLRNPWSPFFVVRCALALQASTVPIFDLENYSSRRVVTGTWFGLASWYIMSCCALQKNAALVHRHLRLLPCSPCFTLFCSPS